jgi:hypothetical protein
MTSLFDTIHALWEHRPNGPVAKKISKLKAALESESYSEALGLADDPTFIELSTHIKKMDRKIPATESEKNSQLLLRQNFIKFERARIAENALKNDEILYAADLAQENPKAFDILVSDESVLSHRVKMEAARKNADHTHGYSAQAAKANYVYGLPDDDLRWDVLYETINDRHIPQSETAGVLMQYVHPLGRKMRNSQISSLKMLVSDQGYDIFEEGAVERYGADQMEAFFRATNEMILRNEDQAIDILMGSMSRLDKYIAASSVHYQAPVDYKNAVPDSLIGNGASAARLKIAEILLEADPAVHLSDAAYLVREVLLDDSAFQDQNFKSTQKNAVSLLKKIIFTENNTSQFSGQGAHVVKELLASDHNIDRNLGKKIAEEIQMEIDPLIRPRSNNNSPPKPL